MDRERIVILLKEYEICQQSINSHSSRFWVIVGIFIAINTALLGWVAVNIISKSPAANVEWIVYIQGNLTWLVMTSVLGLGVTVVLIFLLFWLNRVNWFIRTTYYRM